MSENLHIQMHVDHTHWFSEGEFWRGDIRVWNTEIDQALRDVERLTAALRAQSEALHAHFEAIGKHEQEIRSHERSLAGYEKGGTGEELIALAKAHDKERELQAATRQAHERIKKFHHGLLAQWNLLLKAISKAM